MTPIQIERFLKTNFRKDVSSVQFVGAGMFSQAFSFRTRDGNFVIRLNEDDEDFRKDQFAYERFLSPTLPIPAMVQLGRFDASYAFAITERCAGKTLETCSEASLDRVLPSIFQALSAMRQIDVSNVQGWGLLDAHGAGCFESWEACLLDFDNRKLPFEWESLFGETFLERSVVDAFMKEMNALLPYCASEKYLVHGDFGFDNVISDGETITGVLDWAEDRYGDFIYDVAYLDFWSKNLRYGDLYAEHCAERGERLPNFEERMVCYMLHIGLGSLAIAAIQRDERSYLRVRERMRSIFKKGRRSATDWTQ